MIQRLATNVLRERIMTRRDNSTYSLYRHFDADHNLLYVGISLSTLQRIGEHKSSAVWFDLIALVTIERFSNKAKALEAEKAAIKNEGPFYNVVHGPIEKLETMAELRRIKKAKTDEDDAISFSISAVKDSAPTIKEMSVLVLMVKNANKKGKVLVSQQFIADQMGVTQQSICGHMRSLTAKGLVKKKKRKGFAATEFTLCKRAVWASKCVLETTDE